MKKHFLIWGNEISGEREARAACAHSHLVPLCSLSEDVSEVTCGLCKITHAFKEKNQSKSQFRVKTVDEIIEALHNHYIDGNIKMLSVAYTLVNKRDESCEMHAKTETELISMIELLERCKLGAVKALKQKIETTKF